MVIRKTCFRVLSVFLMMALMAAMAPSEVEAATGAWVYEKTVYLSQDGSRTWLDEQPSQIGGTDNDGGHEIGRMSAGKMELDKNRANRLIRNNPDKTTPEIIRMDFTWTQPPNVIRPDENYTLTLNREVFSFQHGDWYPRYWVAVKSGVIGTNLGNIMFRGPDGVEYQEMVWTDSSWGAQQSTTEAGRRYVSMDSLSGTWGGMMPAGTTGQQRAVEVSIGHLLGTFYAERHLYNWQEGAVTPAPAPVPAPTPAPVPSTGSSVESFTSGVRMEWPATSGLGYRVFRSTNPNQEGISITDFYITTTRIVDVNVEPNTEYHYTIRPVLAEARPLQGVEERLGDVIASFTQRTGSGITNVGEQKGFIILQLENPMMVVNGISQEIDPGRGTTPIIIAGRSMVPIRAIVEAMGGNVGWDGSASKITLNARGNEVEMWLNRNDVRRNGNNARMDVAPVSQGGRTFVPVRFASENLDAKADWINSTREVVIVFTQ